MKTDYINIFAERLAFHVRKYLARSLQFTMESENQMSFILEERKIKSPCFC